MSGLRPVVGVALVGLLMPVLATPPAAAGEPGSTSVVTFEPVGHRDSGAAGTCLLYRMVAQDAAFEPTVTEPGQSFAAVTLTETGDVDSQDVDFCAVDGKGDDFKRAPRYYTAGSGSSGTPAYYNPGWTLTPEESGNPDRARQDVPPATSSAPAGRPDKADHEPSPSTAGAHNYLSLDQAIVGYDADAGGFVFGVVGARDGQVELSGYLDHNGDGMESREVPGVSPGDVPARVRSLTLTTGGAPYGLAVADAVRAVVASPRSVSAVAGDPGGASVLATVTNAQGQPLAGVRPRLAAEGGPNAAGDATTWAGSCAASDSKGQSACTYSGQLPGTDDVAVYVNQSTSGGSAARDASEPFDVVQVTLTRTAVPPSPSSEATPSTSPSPSDLPSPSSPTTPSSQASPTAPAARDCTTSTTVDREIITATRDARVVVHGPAEQVVQLLAYSRPSTAYRVVREGVTGPDGRAAFTVRPLTSTRLYAAAPDCSDSVSQVVLVRSALSLSARRMGPRDLLFDGRAVPARASQLVSLYRVAPGGQQVLTAQARADSTGRWSVRRVFGGTGRFGFVARTGADMVNAAGSSPVRLVEVR